MIRKHIPNAVTILNLVLGFASILLSISSNYTLAAIAILLALVFDLLDGTLARSLNATSKFGLQLDSLADAVSFVIAPAILIYFNFFTTNWVAIVIASFVVVTGIMRLAKFNTLPSGKHFVGLPTPVFALIIAIIILSGITIREDIASAITLLLSYLMISSVKLPNFKGKKFEIYKYILGAILLLAVLILIIYYVIS